MKNAARLTVYELNGKRVEVLTLTARRFREGTHPLLSDASYRKKKRVRWIVGAAYDDRGAVEAELLRGYDARGGYIGERVLKATQIRLDTLPHIRATLRRRPRHHEGLPAPLRKKVVAVVAKELSRARRLADVAKYLSIPLPTLTRWTHGVPRKRPPMKKRH